MPKPGQLNEAHSSPDPGGTELALPAAYVLEVAIGERKPDKREFAKPQIIIGRETGDLVLGDPRCSSRHAEILFDGQRVRLRDLASTNGTWCGGQRVHELLWTPGASVHIGSCKLTLLQVRTEDGRGLTVAIAGPPTALALGSDAATPLLGVSRASGMRARVRKQPRWVWASAGLGVLAVAGTLTYQRLRPEPLAVPEPAMTETRETNVQFVWVSGDPPNEHGGTSTARIRVGPNTTDTVSVGVAEEFAKGSGDQWRTATWLAAFNATRAQGTSLASYEFNVHVGGHVDGPSAGMLTTVAMLALMNGKQLRADTTMTGTINPDGSAGPVGGILAKMQGAKEAGLTRFGFPIGTRIRQDAQNNSTDLVEEARRLGLEAQEISDVYQAYAFATGEQLARPTPLDEAELNVSDATQSLLRAGVLSLKARVEREHHTLKSEKAHFKATEARVAGLRSEAEQAWEKALRDERNNYQLAALSGYAQAAIFIAMARRVATVLDFAAQRDVAALDQLIKTGQSFRRELDAFGQQLEVRAAARTRGGQLSSAAAYMAYVEANAAMQIADELANDPQILLASLRNGTASRTPPTMEKVGNAMLLPVLFYDIAHEQLEFSRHLQDLILDEGDTPPLGEEAMNRVAAGYASAAAAVVACFDAVVLMPNVDQHTTLKDAQAKLAENNVDYFLARSSVALAEYGGGPRKSTGETLMRLAAAGYAYLTGATLLNRHYSLNGGRPTTEIENVRALSAQLDLARHNAMEAAGRAKRAAGFIPTAALLAYQLARARREGSDEDKLEALQAYWESSFWSELAAGLQ